MGFATIATGWPDIIVIVDGQRNEPVRDFLIDSPLSHELFYIDTCAFNK